MPRFSILVAVFLVLAVPCPAFATELQAVGVGSQHQEEHCTALVLDNDGYGVFGANFDHTLTDEGLVFINKRGIVKSSTQTGTTGRRALWTSRYASVSFNLVGYEYAWGGMNESGLSLSTMSLDETRQPSPDERPPLDSGEWVQYILDTCATVEDVVATDSQVRIFTVDHYLSSDRFGNAVAVEFLDGRMVTTAFPDLTVATLTNNTYRELIAVWEMLRGHGGYSGLASSLQRFCLAADRVEDFQATSDEEAVAYAFDTLHQVRGERFSASPTNWSLVFDAKNLRAYYRTSRNRAIRWIDLAKLDLRCGRPVMMIDIHDGGPGSVTDELFDFDSVINRAHLERFLRVWGVNLPPSSITWILNHFGGFHCVLQHRRAPRRIAP